jgi:oligopeptide/dipeptide ABC transporter ATP-binding protein
MAQQPAAQPVSPDVVLAVDGVRTEFVGRDSVVTAVRDVSFAVRRGEKIAIVGESGCGKSALALSILGLIEPPGRVVGGRVVLNGREISRFSDRELQRVRGREISLIFQDPMTALDPVKTIGHQIAEVVRHHQSNVSRRGARRRALELLREVEVPHADQRLGEYPHQYSGGMRQRVMIAIALANEPDLIIADEPTTALDVTTQAQVLELLERLVARRDTAVVLITHNLGLVAQFCDTVYVMYAGRFVEHARVEDIFTRPTHPYSEALLRSVPRPDRLELGPLPSIPGFPPNLAQLPVGCSFEPRCPLGHGREICREQAPRPVEVGSARRRVIAECHFARERWDAFSAEEASR